MKHISKSIDSLPQKKSGNGPQAPVEHLVDAATCTICHGLGWVKDADSTSVQDEGGWYPEGKLEKCPACSADERQEWLRRNCGLVGGEMMDARLENWRTVFFDEEDLNKQRRVAGSKMQQATGSPQGLYTFYGDFGSGKTRALATVCNELRAGLVETHYVPLAGILNHLRSLYARKEDTSTYWERLLHIPVLALDEVTRFNATQWAQEMLFLLVDTRYLKRATHLTLFATNDDPTTPMPVEEALGYMFSRLQQGNVVKLRGDVRPALKG